MIGILMVSSEIETGDRRAEMGVRGQPVDLTATEFEVLGCLLNNSGRAPTYRSLVRRLHRKIPYRKRRESH